MMINHAAVGFMAFITIVGASPVHAAFLDNLLGPANGAQDRCLMYGFKVQRNVARCTELEMDYAKPKRWGLGDINRAQNKCLVIGFRDDDLAACVMRQLRHLQ
jgi:hypothetical protein